jgi:hypothetical protein
MRYVCQEERRLQAVRAAGRLNGIAFIEVSGADAPTPALNQRTLFVHLLLPALSADTPQWTPELVRIGDGQRIPTVEVEWVAPADALPAGEKPELVAGIEAAERNRVLVVRTRYRGDFSRYTLRLVAGAHDERPRTGFDPLLAALDFSFKVDCDADFDCAEEPDCPPEPGATPAIDYVAKDYSALRRLMLDRLSLLAPDWRERSPADLGVVLTELLAYLADRLSYRQDAIATEAYLGTARSRISLRRHARLVDYRVHEGCNARVWVQIGFPDADPEADEAPGGAGTVTLPAGTPILTRVTGLPPRLVRDGPEHRAALAAGATVFETVDEVVLRNEHARFDFYTWGAEGCCLPAGATGATLLGEHPALAAGDVLVLTEIRDPVTGERADADPAHRWAVRLTSASIGSDPSGGRFLPEPTDDAVAVTEIRWDDADALPFPLCISDEHGTAVAVAHGNIVLADHGQSIVDEQLGQAGPERYRPGLALGPLTHAPVRPAAPAAGTVTAGGPEIARTALPAIVLTGRSAGEPDEHWYPRPDLLGSAPDAPEFVVETEHDGRVTLRFGTADGTVPGAVGSGLHGRRPAAGTAFTARYRIGNGTAGNVGAQSLHHVVTDDGRIGAAVNWLPAAGGTDPESADEVRRDAPQAFTVQRRAVTEQDYADAAVATPGVQRAAARLRWTGSWHTVFVTADRFGAGPVDARFEERLRTDLERYRMAGYDIEVDGPRYVPLELDLAVCLDPEHLRGRVRRELLAVLGSSVLPDGRRGLFHPDNWTFGQPVYLSAVYAAAQSVPGVASITVRALHRQRERSRVALDRGLLAMGRLEIAQLENDPNFPERGVLKLDLGGGR